MSRYNTKNSKVEIMKWQNHIIPHSPHDTKIKKQTVCGYR